MTTQNIAIIKAYQSNRVTAPRPQFTSEDLSEIVKKIKDLEANLKKIIAEKAYKEVEEHVYITKEKEREYSFVKEPIPWMLVKMGVKKPEMVEYQEVNIVTKKVKKSVEEVDLSEFREIIHSYIDELENLNVSLEHKIVEVNATIDAITQTIISFEREIQNDLISFETAQKTAQQINDLIEKLKSKLTEYKRTDEEYFKIASQLETLGVELDRSLAEESRKAKTQKIKASYQNALRQYRSIVSEFSRKGEEHCDLVRTFSNGTRHMADAVSDVAQIVEGVGKATSAMAQIVESVEEGNGVLSEYATLIDQTAIAAHDVDKFEKLETAKEQYEKREEKRKAELEKTREEMANIISGHRHDDSVSNTHSKDNPSTNLDSILNDALEIID